MKSGDHVATEDLIEVGDRIDVESAVIHSAAVDGVGAERAGLDGDDSTTRSRSGIIAIESSPLGPDTIYGGGMYDRRFNIDPISDFNQIFRCYMIAALHPAPAEALNRIVQRVVEHTSWEITPPIRHLTSVK